MKIRQLIVEPVVVDEDGHPTGEHLYTILTEDGRMFVGGIHGVDWRWMEIPPPTPENTKWYGEPPFTQGA